MSGFKNQLAELPELKVTYVPVTSLVPAARNARTHSKKQVRQIADSIKAFGFNSPLLVDTGDTVVAGHGRLAAAKLLGMQSLPVIRTACFAVMHWSMMIMRA